MAGHVNQQAITIHKERPIQSQNVAKLLPLLPVQLWGE
jgi:hypothetical protein